MGNYPKKPARRGNTRAQQQLVTEPDDAGDCCRSAQMQIHENDKYKIDMLLYMYTRVMLLQRYIHMHTTKWYFQHACVSEPCQQQATPQNAY